MARISRSLARVVLQVWLKARTLPLSWLYRVAVCLAGALGVDYRCRQHCMVLARALGIRHMALSSVVRHNMAPL